MKSSKLLSRQILLVIVLVGSVFSPMLLYGQMNVSTQILRFGMHGEEVTMLQKFLNTDTETQVSETGPGSLGSETNYFGPATKRALIKFQEKYRGEILTPLGLMSGTGILGVKTLEKINMIKEAIRVPLVIQKQLLEKETSSRKATILTEQEKRVSVVPVRLIIPNIYVDAIIEPVGLTSLGAMDVSKGPANAAWFELGPLPGEIGSSVVNGHSGWKNGIPAVFDNLHKLQPGHKIYVVDKEGTTVVFTVREIRLYDQNADSSSVFDSVDGKAHLNLITCDGLWNRSLKSSPNRLVVFADKE